MTAQQPEQEPQPRPSSPQQRAAVIAGLIAAGATAGGAAAATGAAAGLTATTLRLLTRLFLRWGYDRNTIRYALRVVTRVVRVAGPVVSPVGGPATDATRRREHVFAAWFLERSAERVRKAYAVSEEAGEAAEAREERYIDQHLDAQDRRLVAAERVDAETAKRDNVTDGPDEDGMGRGRVILKWRAHPDDRVTPECRAADGAWFYADTPPIIGYPGMPHGGTCRCWPAHAGSLAEVARGRHVNEAVRAIIMSEPDHRDHPGTSERTVA